MIPLNTSYPNRYSIRGRASYPWYRQGFASPIIYPTTSWPNNIPAQGRAQRPQLVSYYPSRSINTSCGNCGWKCTDAVYSSQGFGQIVGGTHGGVLFHSTQSHGYTSCRCNHGRGQLDRNSWVNMYNGNRFHHPAGPANSNIIYFRSNPATTNHVTRQPSSTFIQPGSRLMPMMYSAVNFRDTVAWDPPVPPLVRPDIDDNEAPHHCCDSFENSPQAAQKSSSTTKCSCYHCTDRPFYDESSDQSDTESASTYATGDGWNSPVSPPYVSVEPVDSNGWNNNQRNACFGNYQSSYFSQTTSSLPTYRLESQNERRQRQQRQAHFELQYPPQFYQRPMDAYGPNPKVLCQQQNYIGFHYVSGQYIQMMPYQNNGMANEQPLNCLTPLHLDIPEVAFVQVLTNGLKLEESLPQPNQMQNLHSGEDSAANQMLLKICADDRPPTPRNSTPEVWEREYEELPNYDDLVMPGSPRVSRYFPTVPVEYAEESYSTETKNTVARATPGTSNRKAYSLPFATMQQRPLANVHPSKYIPHQLPRLHQARAELLAGGGMHHVNEEINPYSFMHDAMGRRRNERLGVEEMNTRRSISFTSFRNYYDTHNQPDGVAGNSSTGMHSTPNGNVGGAASSATMQRAPPSQQQFTTGFSGSQQNGRRAERDSDVSNITLRTLLETPYSPRTRNARNLELEEYQRMLAEEELQKELDALKAKENADKKENNEYTNTTMGTQSAED